MPTVRPLLLALLLAPAASAQSEVEPFGPSGFTNPFFMHDFEFAPPAWDVVPTGPGDWELHLMPNTDFITWTLPPGKAVQSVQGVVTDFEAEPFSPGGTSAFIARSASGDFAVFNTDQIAVPELAQFDVDTPGALTGLPLLEIVEIQLQASNTGSSAGVGALFDDITVELVDSAFTNLGQGLAGTNGVPLLVGEGDLQPDTAYGLTAQGAPAGAPAILAVGFGQIDQPLLGGVLVPSPDVAVTGLSADASGTLELASTWPATAPAGQELFWQVWFVDAGGPFGVSATNGVKSTAP